MTGWLGSASLVGSVPSDGTTACWRVPTQLHSQVVTGTDGQTAPTTTPPLSISLKYTELGYSAQISYHIISFDKSSHDIILHHHYLYIIILQNITCRVMLLQYSGTATFYVNFQKYIFSIKAMSNRSLIRFQQLKFCQNFKISTFTVAGC